MTKEEYLAYVKLCSRPVLKNRGAHLEIWVILVTLGGILTLMGLAALALLRPAVQDTPLWFISMLILGIITIGMGLKLRGIPAKIWEKNQDTLGKHSGVVADDRVEVHTPNGNLGLTWTEMDGYGEHEGMIVLFKAPMFALPFVERFFASREDWLAFRETVLQHLQVSHRMEQGAPSSRFTATILLLVVIVLVVVYYYLQTR